MVYVVRGRRVGEEERKTKKDRDLATRMKERENERNQSASSDRGMWIRGEAIFIRYWVRGGGGWVWFRIEPYCH